MEFHSMKRKELQALCKKHKVPASLTNLEMANRLTSLLKGKDKFFTGRRSCLKALDENGSENESDVENKRVKKVRFSPETQMIEFQKSEAKRQGSWKSVINKVGVVGDVGGRKLSERVGHVTRSRGRRSVEEVMAERKGGKMDFKYDALGNILPSTVDRGASASVENEEHRMVTRRSSRNREVVDEGKKRNEDMEKVSKKKGRQRNPRRGNVEGNDDVAERRESDVENLVVQGEKVLRRSKRNVTRVEDYKLLSNEMVTAGRTFKPVARAVSKGPGHSGVDIDAERGEKESPLVRVATRRSRRNASKHEPSIAFDNIATKRQRSDPVLEEAVEIDSITIEMPLRRSSGDVNRTEKATPAIVTRKVAQQKRKLKKQTENIEDSYPEELTTKKLLDVDVQPSMTEITECRDSDNEGLIDNLKQQRKRSGKNSGRKSRPMVQYSSMGVAELKNDEGQLGAETSQGRTKMFAQDANVKQEIKKKNSAQCCVSNCYSEEPAVHCPRGTAEQESSEDSNVGGGVISPEKLSAADSCLPVDQSDSTDLNGIQVWVELPIDMQTLSRPASLDQVVEDEGISSKKSQECIEHEGLDTVHDHVPEKYGNAGLNGACKRDGFTCSEKDKSCEVDPANSEDAKTAMVSGCDSVRKLADPDFNNERNSTLNSGRALDQSCPSLSMQTNGCELDNVAGQRHFDQEELKVRCTKPAKSDEHNSLEKNYGDSNKCCESNGPEPSNLVTSLPDDGNVNGRVDSKQPADLLVKHLESPSPFKCLDDPELEAVSKTIVKSGQSFSQDTSVRKQDENVDEMDLEKYLEQRELLSSIQSNDVESDDLTEAEKHFADVKSSAELSKSDEEENIFDKFRQYNVFDSSGCKLSISEDLDANDVNHFVADADSQRMVLGAQDFATQTIEGSKKIYEDEPQKDGNAGSIECCVRDTEKKDRSYEEPANSVAPMAAMISGAGNVIHIPTRDYIEESTTSTMNLNITLEQAEQSPFLQMYDSEADNVAEEGIAYYQVELKCNELARAECTSAKKDNYEENPVNAEDTMAATKCRTSISPHVSVGNNNDIDEYASAMNLDVTLGQREQSPIVHWRGCEAVSVAGVHRNYDQVELKCHDLSNSADDRPLVEQYHSSNNFCESFISDSSIRSARSTHQDEIDDGEDSIKHKKNAPGSKTNYEDEPHKDENFGFIQSLLREECASAREDNNYKENPLNSDDPMAGPKCGTGNSLHVSIVHNNEEPTSTMNLDISLEHSLVVHRHGCEADSVAEVDRKYDLVELKYELSKSKKNRATEQKYHSPNKCSESSARSIMEEGEDSMKWEKNITSSRKTYEDGTENDGNNGSTNSCITEKCISAKNESNCEDAPVYTEDPMEAVISGTGNSADIPVVDNYEHTGLRNSDKALDHREQSPILQMSGCDEENLAKEDRSHDQVEMYCYEAAESVKDRCLEEQYHSPNKCLESSVSDSRRSAGRMLQDEIVNGGEDPKKHQEKSYEDAPEEDVNAGSNESYVINKYTTAKNHPENSKEAIISITGNIAHIPVVKNEDDISTMSSEITLEQSEQSPTMQKNGCDTDNSAEKDGNHEHKELSCSEFVKYVEDRPFQEKYHSPNKYSEPSACDPSGRTLQDEIVNAGEDYIESADFLGTSIVNPSLAAKTVDRECPATDFSSSIFNCGNSDPVDPSPPLDGPAQTADAMKQPSSVLRNNSGADDVAEAHKTYEDVKNCVELASFERVNNDTEDVGDVRKSQGLVLTVQKSAYVIEGYETFAEDRKNKESNGISEKTLDFASTELSESKLTLNVQEEFSCNDKEYNAKDKRENPAAATFSEVQFTMSEIHREEKILQEIQDGLAPKLYNHHEMLKESDVLDTINEYIDSESTRNLSLRIDDTSDTLHVDVLRKVAELEAQKAEETTDTTGRKFEPSVEGDNQEKGEAVDLAETAPGSAWISESKSGTIQSKNSDIVADENSFLGKQFKSEMREKIRAILIHGTPKKLQTAAHLKENVPSSKMEKVGSLTTVKPATKRTALKDLRKK